MQLHANAALSLNARKGMVVAVVGRGRSITEAAEPQNRPRMALADTPRCQAPRNAPHALRHIAAASWLTTGHSLIFVARQLGHRSIPTTEQRYRHLELNLFSTALQATDDAISRAGADQRAD